MSGREYVPMKIQRIRIGDSVGVQYRVPVLAAVAMQVIQETKG